ncbi:MAG TPA: hypothetical protein PKN63_11245, partial [Chitinophagales bacterium]|nr:hypothetical protein [Chitinophagales bacterium]
MIKINTAGNIALLKCGKKCKQLKVLCIFIKQNIAKSAVVKCRTSAMPRRCEQVLPHSTNGTAV